MSLRRFGYSLGKAQTRRPWLFVLAALLITLATLPGIPLLLGNVEPSLEKVLPQDLEEVKVMNDMRSQFGADMLYLVLETDGDVYGPDELRYLDALTQALRDVENVREVMGVADVLKENGGGSLPLVTQDAVALARADPRVATLVNRDRSLTVLQLRADTGASAAAVDAVVKDIRSTVTALDATNPGFTSRLTGFNAIDNATFQVILSDFARITLVSFALMVGFLLVHYRFSVKKTLYSLAIMVFALLWALGITGYLGIELNVVTMVSAAMIMALGSSYGINSVYHFYDDFLLQYDREEAIAKFQEFLIVGLTGSALAEIAGFLALLFGLMPSMRALGVILAIGISCALIVSVFVLPALFALLEKDHANAKANA